MNPYLMMLLQRIGASPMGQRGADVLDRMRLFEASRIPLTRGAGGRYMPATAGQKVPLSPLGRGVAGGAGLGMVAGPGVLSERQAAASNSQIPSEMWEQLNRTADVPVREMMDRPTEAEGRQTPYDYPRQEEGAMAAPMPPRRPANLPGAREVPMPPRRPEDVSPSSRATEAVIRQILSGRDYQSNARPVVEDRRVNFGDPESAADFFRAERAAREMGSLPPVERASGGQVGGGQNGGGKAHKDAALVKALEIIERLMANR